MDVGLALPYDKNETVNMSLRINTSAVNENRTSENDAYYYYETEQLATLSFLLVAIVVGNTSVLLAQMLTKRRKSRVNFFISNLAFADILVGLISVPTDLVWRLTVDWYAGNSFCKIVKFAQIVVTYSSTYVLVALSIDRYEAIKHPMNFSKGLQKARILVLLAWLLSCLFSSPVLILFEEQVIAGRMQCWIQLEPWQWKLYMSLVFLTLFLFPALIIATCYAVIVHTIWAKSSMMVLAKRKMKGDCEEDSKRVSSRGIIPRAKVKTIKMTLVIVFVFIASWSPYMVHNLLQVYEMIPKSQTTIAISSFIQSLAPINSAVNPVIYWCFSTYMCRDLRNKVKWLGIARGAKSGRVTDTSSLTDSVASSRRTIQMQHLNLTYQKPLLTKMGTFPMA